MGTSKRITTRFLAGLTLLAGVAGGRAAAQPTADQLLARKPVQPGVAVTTPAGADLAGCKVEQKTWGAGAAGVVVRDAGGRLVRQFVQTPQGDIGSFYLNGVEAYRETDVNKDGKPDLFRWLGPNGGKWGKDENGDGVIDVWYVLSPEELSQELFAVFQTMDARRLTPLLPREDEVKALGLPPAEVAKLLQRSAGAGKRIEAAVAALKPAAEAKWVHLELGVPHTTPGDALGSQTDVVVHKNGTVLFDKGDGKSADVFQTGEMILVGRAWRLVDGPLPGAAVVGDTSPGEIENLPEAVRKLLLELQAAKTPAERAAILEKIVAQLQGAAQEQWLKQLVDAYAGAAEAGEPGALDRLKAWQGQMARVGGPAAGYAAFRVIATEYALKLKGPNLKPDEVSKVQAWWRDQLEAFVKAYPQAEDAPEALLRLAVACEFAGKDGEAQAKTWYETLAKNYAGHPYAGKAEGAVRRLTCEGQPFALTGPVLGSGAAFSTAQLAGKPAVVYYWASWAPAAAGDLQQLGELAKVYGPKGLEVVTVSLDDEAAKAAAALSAAPVAGTHLYAPGGLDRSPLAVAYGVQMVPHVFLVGKDGKVVNRNAQMGPPLKDEVEKLVK